VKNPQVNIVVILVVLLALGATFIFGVYFGFENRPEVQKITEVLNKETNKPSGVDFDPFWKAWATIDDKYVGASATSSQDELNERLYGAISGLVGSLEDPYSIFLPPEEKEIFEDDISGAFSGVGMEIGIRDGTLLVIAPLPDSPAERAGVLAGDIIIAIDGARTQGMRVDEAVKLIRGEVGTEVTLTVVRNNTNDEIDLSVTRDVISIPTIRSQSLPSGAFLIQIHNFGATAPALFRDALRDFVSTRSGMLILDLRGNPGGFLESAVDIASWFMPSGKAVVREERRDDGDERVYRSKGYDIFTDSLQVAVLIDRGSASASEILAGALREHGIAILIGEKTFGKGSVQELLPITPDSSLKLTTARWLTPNGLSISDDGLEPDVEVIPTQDDIDNLRDPQLEKAEEILLDRFLENIRQLTL